MQRHRSSRRQTVTKQKRQACSPVTVHQSSSLQSVSARAATTSVDRTYQGPASFTRQMSSSHRPSRGVSSVATRRSFSTTSTRDATTDTTPLTTANKSTPDAQQREIPTTIDEKPSPSELSVEPIQSSVIKSPEAEKRYEIHKAIPIVTEEALLEKVKYDAKMKSSRMFRFTEYIRDHQSQTRAAIVGIPSAAVAYTTYDISTYIISLLDSMAVQPAFMMHAIMGLGAANAAVAYGLYHNANKILSLAGQPSEAAIQDIIRRTCRNDTLRDLVGPTIKLGHFCAVSTRLGEPRFTNNKIQHYEEWLNFDKKQYTSPIPDIPFPHFIQKWLSMVPAFQTVAYNVGAAERIAADIKAHPEDYIEGYTSDDSEPEDASTSKVKKTGEVDEASEAEAETKSDATEADKISKADAQRDERLRKHRITGYSGWERYWKPRRLQFTLHLLGEKDEGLLLCEVEKYQFGKGFPQSGGNAQYKVFQFISLRNGAVTNIDSPERPSLLSHAHVQKLFDTLPVLHPNVSHATYDYILVEDKYADEVKQHVNNEKQKTGVGIYY